MPAETMTKPRMHTEQELAVLVKQFRDTLGWSQETLSALSGLNVRTIQRVERGEPSDRDTRRALARAFQMNDIDYFNKPHSHPSEEETKEMMAEFERQHEMVDAKKAATGAELGKLFHEATGDYSETAADDIEYDAAVEFAALVDFLREFRDIASEISEMEKLELYGSMQEHLERLDKLGVSVVYAVRHTKLLEPSWPDQTPMPVTLAFVKPFPKGKEPKVFLVPKGVRFG